MRVTRTIQKVYRDIITGTISIEYQVQTLAHHPGVPCAPHSRWYRNASGELVEERIDSDPPAPPQRPPEEPVDPEEERRRDRALIMFDEFKEMDDAAWKRLALGRWDIVPDPTSVHPPSPS